MYAWQDGGLVWQEPEAENAHIEITVLERGLRYRRWRSVRRLEIRRACDSNGCAVLHVCAQLPTAVRERARAEAGPYASVLTVIDSQGDWLPASSRVATRYV